MALNETLNYVVGSSSSMMQREYGNVTATVEYATTTEIPYESYALRPETYMVPIIFGFIFVVGVIGNGTLIIVFLRHRAMRNVPNT